MPNITYSSNYQQQYKFQNRVTWAVPKSRHTCDFQSDRMF